MSVEAAGRLVRRPSPLVRYSLSRSAADVLGKRWTDSVVTGITFLAVVGWASSVDPQFLTTYNLNNIGIAFAILALSSLALAATVVGGGIDVSVVGTYAVVSVAVLTAAKETSLPLVVLMMLAPVAGALIGWLNAVLTVTIGTRPLLTTLVVLAVLRSVLSFQTTHYNDASLGSVTIVDPWWTFVKNGTIVGASVPLVATLVIATGLHLVHTRTRVGSRFVATGASERSAKEAGVDTSRTRFGTYVLAGALAGVAGVFSAASLSSASTTIGDGREFAILAVLVLAGVSLAGGVGTVPRVLVAALTITILDFTLTNIGQDLNVNRIAVGTILLLAIAINTKFTKHRGSAIAKLSVTPAPVRWYGQIPDVLADTSPWRVNRRLTGATPLGLGRVEGPEDCAVGPDGALYCGDRRGWVWKMSGEGYGDVEVFARLGGSTLGMTFDRDRNLLVCASGRGLVMVTPDGRDVTIADRTRRSFGIKDDRRLRLVDDLDVTPDGRIWFSEASKRFDVHEWMFEMYEGRPNGRLLCHDPATGQTRTVRDELFFPNGVCSAHDRQSILVASTTGCAIHRYFHTGPRAGEMEVFLDGLPGYPDNINRSADGGYWVGFVGVRNPAFDLVMADAGMKRRMVKSLPADEWMFPNINLGCLIKLDADGRLVDCLWDETMSDHSMVTSMRESGDRLFVGGLTNNRVGMIEVDVEPSCRCGQPPCATESVPVAAPAGSVPQ